MLCHTVTTAACLLLPSTLCDNMPKTQKISTVSQQEGPPSSIHEEVQGARWVVAEEATMVATLLLQKASGNASESGFKPVVWAVVVHTVGIATAEPLKKTLFQCKTCYHRVSAQYYIYVLLSADYLQLKAKYKSVQTLCRLSGFGWDEGEKMVTAPLQVWDTYLQISQLSSCVSFQLTTSYVQSHHKAKKFMTKTFPLFDNLAELCDAVIMTGVGAFRGTGDSSNEQDAKGSVEEEDDYEEQAVSTEPASSEDLASSAETAVSEDWDTDDPMVL